jgi:hypothetical protein
MPVESARLLYQDLVLTDGHFSRRRTQRRKREERFYCVIFVIQMS